MKESLTNKENRCEISFNDGKYLCKVFFGCKLWNVFETNFKGLKKIMSSLKKKNYSMFNML